MSLVERDAALASLVSWDDEVQAGHGRLVLVSGEAGPSSGTGRSASRAPA